VGRFPLQHFLPHWNSPDGQAPQVPSARSMPLQMQRWPFAVPQRYPGLHPTTIPNV
jgi:hypothetical protein